MRCRRVPRMRCSWQYPRTSTKSDDFPEWGVGELVAIWEDAGLHLRLHHEDPEVPIFVALGWNQ